MIRRVPPRRSIGRGTPMRRRPTRATSGRSSLDQRRSMGRGRPTSSQANRLGSMQARRISSPTRRPTRRRMTQRPMSSPNVPSFRSRMSRRTGRPSTRRTPPSRVNPMNRMRQANRRAMSRFNRRR